MPQTAIVRSLSKLCASATVDELFLDPWPYEVNIRWTSIVARNPDSKSNKIALGLLQGTDFYVLSYGGVGTAGYTFEHKADVTAPGNFRPGARFYGATVGDELEVYCYGVLEIP